MRRAAFGLWAAWLRLALRRRGARLVLDAPHGARLRGLPRLELIARAKGDATFHLRLGRNVTFGAGVRLRIDPRGTNVLDLADNVHLQDGARLWMFSGTLRMGRGSILRDMALLKTSGELLVGEYVRIGYCTVVHCHERIEIEDRVGMADLIMVIDSDHLHDGSDVWVMDQPVGGTPVRIGRNCLIGSSSVLTRGADVGRNSIVAAGAVVRSGEYPSGWVLAGVPAKPLRALSGEPASR